MANQRKQGIERITLTLPDAMLARLEAEAESRGIDRLAIMREAIAQHLGAAALPRPTSAKRAAKPKPAAKEAAATVAKSAGTTAKARTKPKR